MPLAFLLLSAALAAPADDDAALREALELVYDGATDGGLARLEALAAAAPRDPLPAYLSALALCWKIEQRGDSRALDRELVRRADAAVALADARLREDPNDARALLARAGGWGAKGRLQLFRRDKRESARSAVRMRSDLSALLSREPGNLEALFGLGLYDYYADVLPRLLRLLSLLIGIPGGDRARGLARIERATQAPLHDTEARAQLYEIYAFYENRPDRAYDEILALRQGHPASPLWALKLAEHERIRMGLYAESAQVYREIQAAVARGEPNYAPVVGLMARLGLGESLLLDLRLPEARRELLDVQDAAAEAPALAQRARALLGRSREVDGDRALGFIAEARRLREAREPRDAANAYRRARALSPDNAEAALGAAEDDLERGRLAAARKALRTLGELRAPDPPWLEPWAWLLRARAHDLDGERAAALAAYRKVRDAPLGREELRRAATAGLETPYLPGAADEPSPASINNIK